MKIHVAYSYDFAPEFIDRVRECYGITVAGDVRPRLKMLLHNIGLQGLVDAVEAHENAKASR